MIGGAGARIETICPLAPLQEGMLFHALLEPEAAPYVLQQTFHLQGPFDADLFQDAFQAVVARHAALRTAFSWKRTDRPLQVVLENVLLPVRREDWSGLGAAEQEARLSEFLDSDRRRGFALDRAPLLRLAIVRLGQDSVRLVATWHHACLDAWSEGLVFREVIALYAAALGGEEPRLPEPRPYSDYIDWLRAQDLAQAESFWREQLRGLQSPTTLSLPAPSTPGGAERSGRQECLVRLSPDSSAGLRAMARRGRLTVNSVVLGAWALLLSRYSGRRDVVFGTVVSGRPAELPGVESMVGLFINALPVRVRIPPSTPLLTWLCDLQRSQLRARPFQHSPLVQVQGWSELPRGTPLFESMVAFASQALEPALPQGSGLALADVHGDVRLTMPLAATVVPGPELEVRLQYDAGRFEPAAVEAMLEHLRGLMEAMVADPERRLADLPAMSGEERRRVLEEWNATAIDRPGPSCVHELFEARADERPDAVAVTHEGRRWSYRELNRRANQVAHHLLRLGVRRGEPVAICLRRSPEMVAGLLGILKAGGAYLPLDPAYPKRRLAFMIEDAGARLLVTGSALLPELPAGRATAVCLDPGWDLLAGELDANPERRTGPDDLAYVIYTSGSTGTPKGVMIPHRGIVNYLAWGAAAYEAAAGPAPVHSSISFDLTLTSLVLPLTAGGTIALLPEEAGVDALAEAMQRQEKFGLVKITPAHLEAIGHQLPPAAAAGRARVFVIGGESLSARCVRFWRENAPQSALINEYGPTETVVGCCVHRLPSVLPDAAIPIGRPISNVRMHVLDARLEPVPVGASGELYIGGAGLARGYLGRPGLTAGAFVPDPFATEPGARLYRTGDLARYRPDGCLEFLGRLDEQVKIRGHRIELGEVEAALGGHPAVRDCVVVAREGEAGERRLAAYLVSGAWPPPTPRELRDHLRQTLPAYMVPAAFVVLDRLPLTHNGKVDRGALPAPGAGSPAGADAAPRTPVEKTLAAIWRRVLGVEKVGVRDNFFDLGGDSILAIQIVSRAVREGLYLTPRQLFQNQTVEELAAVAATAPAPSAEQGPVTGPTPLTPVQRWFFELGLEEPDHYNQAAFLESDQPLDLAALQTGLDSLLRHHDVLRTRFRRGGSGWLQEVGPPGGSVPVREEDLRGQPLAEHGATAAWAAAELQRSLDVARGPLLRAGLFRREPFGPDWLLIVIHHLVVDGVSWGILLEDLQTAYEQARARRRIELPAKTTSFQEWARRLLEHAATEDLGREAELWLEMPVEPAGLPLDFAEGDGSEASARSVVVRLEPEETLTLVSRLPQALGGHVQEALLAALVRAFGTWTGERSLLVDLEGHGREDVIAGVDLSRTVGWFTSLYPVLLSADSPRPEARLQQVAGQLRRLPAHGIGYGLLRYLRAAPAVSERVRALPAAEVSFNYLGRLDGPAEPSRGFRYVRDETAAAAAQGPAARSPRNRRSHLIEVLAEVSGGRLLTGFGYSAGRHSRATIEKLARSYLAELRELVRCAAEAGSRPRPGGIALSSSRLERALAEIERG